MVLKPSAYLGDLRIYVGCLPELSIDEVLLSSILYAVNFSQNVIGIQLCPKVHKSKFKKLLDNHSLRTNGYTKMLQHIYSVDAAGNGPGNKITCEL